MAIRSAMTIVDRLVLVDPTLDAVPTTRLEAFSDGVLAIAITLLIIEVHVPEAHGDLTHQLGRQWPSYVSYVISFAIIGIIWVNHHALVHRVAAVDRTLLFLNLAL